PSLLFLALFCFHASPTFSLSPYTTLFRSERGIAFDCFELSDRVGGNWVWGNSNGVSSSYASLHINTSRSRMEYSDFPMPEHLPRSEEHTSELQSRFDLVCRLLLEKKKKYY